MDIRSGDRVARGAPRGGPTGDGAPVPGMRRHFLPGVLMCEEPAGEALAPVVVDSPHSGRDYPEDFGHSAPIDLLRRAEDAFVDELIADAPAEGAPLLAALFPRSYIDPNRHEADIDESLLTEP